MLYFPKIPTFDTNAIFITARNAAGFKRLWANSRTK